MAKLDTQIVRFRDGSFNGEEMTINASDFDAEKHISKEDADREILHSKQKQANAAKTKDSGAGKDKTADGKKDKKAKEGDGGTTEGGKAKDSTVDDPSKALP